MCAMPAAVRERILTEAAAQGREEMDRVHRDLEAAAAEYAEFGYCSSFGDWTPNVSGIAGADPVAERRPGCSR